MLRNATAGLTPAQVSGLVKEVSLFNFAVMDFLHNVHSLFRRSRPDLAITKVEMTDIDEVTATVVLGTTVEFESNLQESNVAQVFAKMVRVVQNMLENP